LDVELLGNYNDLRAEGRQETKSREGCPFVKVFLKLIMWQNLQGKLEVNVLNCSISGSTTSGKRSEE
jgi:hypothetical protein